MTQVYFHCSNTKEVLVDRCGAVVDDLAEARDHAACVVRSLTMARGLEDWTTSVRNSSLSPLLSCSASRIEVAMLAVQSPRAPLRRCIVGVEMRRRFGVLDFTSFAYAAPLLPRCGIGPAIERLPPRRSCAAMLCRDAGSFWAGDVLSPALFLDRPMKKDDGRTATIKPRGDNNAPLLRKP